MLSFQLARHYFVSFSLYYRRANSFISTPLFVADILPHPESKAGVSLHNTNRSLFINLEIFLPTIMIMNCSGCCLLYYYCQNTVMKGILISNDFKIYPLAYFFIYLPAFHLLIYLILFLSQQF